MTETFKSIERDGWNARADMYGGATALATTQVIPTLLRAVRPRVDARILDICTGPGFVAGAASAIGAKVTGVDFAPDMVAAAKARFGECDFVVGDAEALDFSDDTFDGITCNLGIFHFGEPEKAIDEAFRVLKPGGRYAWSQWFGPDRPGMFNVVMVAMEKHANMDVGLPPAPSPFRLSDPAAAIAAMKDAGFIDIETDEVPVLMRVPEDDFMAFFIRFSVRVTMILDRQTPDALAAIKAAVNEGIRPFAIDGGYAVPVSAMVVSGVKPA